MSMRTDCKIDKRQIRCSHLVPTLGFNKWVAKPGDLIRYQESADCIRLGRVLGRVTAPALGESGPVDGWALCMVLSDDTHAAYERWVDPKLIVQIRDPNPKMAAFFHGPLAYDAQTMRRLMDQGWTSENAVDELPKHARPQNER